MSMSGRLLLLDDQELATLLRSPPTVHELLARRVYEVESPTDFVDIDRAGHAIHFLLVGSAWDPAPPLDFLAVGGEPVGDEYVGFGPARAFRSADVRALDDALSALPPEELFRRFDAVRMDELAIYPGGWAGFDVGDVERASYFTKAYEEVRALLREGAGSGRGLLTWIA